MEGIITSLFAQYSLESIIILIVMLGVAIKGIHELWDFFKQKLKVRFKKEETFDSMEEHIDSKFNTLTDKLDNINSRFDKMDKDFQETKDRLAFIEERQQENTRSFLIDSHHKFCYEVGAIDDINLQSIERRYMYYKTAGGDSFIDGLIKEVRKLPRLSVNNYKPGTASVENDSPHKYSE